MNLENIGQLNREAKNQYGALLQHLLFFMRGIDIATKRSPGRCARNRLVLVFFTVLDTKKRNKIKTDQFPKITIA